MSRQRLCAILNSLGAVRFLISLKLPPLRFRLCRRLRPPPTVDSAPLTASAKAGSQRLRTIKGLGGALGTEWSQGALPIGARFAKFAFGLTCKHSGKTSPGGQVLREVPRRRRDIDAMLMFKKRRLSAQHLSPVAAAHTRAGGTPSGGPSQRRVTGRRDRLPVAKRLFPREEKRDGAKARARF